LSSATLKVALLHPDGVQNALVLWREHMRVRVGNLLALIGLLLLTLSACGETRVIAQDQSLAANITRVDKSGRPVADIIAKLVVNTPPGRQSSVTLEDNQTVNIKVGQDYISAANKKCRSIIVQYPDGRTQINAVCFDGSAWKTVLGKL